MTFAEKIYDTVAQIPKGKVVTYGQLAGICGSPFAGRAVGNILHNNPLPGLIPCHRVVNSKGRLACKFGFGGEEAQKALLAKEGVFVSADYVVDLSEYLWIIK